MVESPGRNPDCYFSNKVVCSKILIKIIKNNLFKHFTTNREEGYTGADLGKKLRGDLYAGIYSKIGSI